MCIFTFTFTVLYYSFYIFSILVINRKNRKNRIDTYNIKFSKNFRGDKKKTKILKKKK
jgi:hypothetical protein